MKKKILALFLCCVMVIGLLPATLAFAAETELKVDADTVSLKTTQMKTLTADAGELTGRYQWQIHDTGNDIWVNILGANEKTLTLNYGLVASLLLNNTARIRCRMTTDGKTLDSNVVTVEIQPDAAVRKAPAMSPAIGTVTSEAKALGDPIIIPAQTPTPAADQTPADESVQENNQPQADETPADNTAQADLAPQENENNDTPATPTTYSIVINYVFENGNTAANQWTATVAAGSSYSQSVQSPVVVGYKPDNETVEVYLTDISKDTTYTVTYQPTTVNFTVKHYQQNVTNDEYTLIDTETKEGVTESAVGANLATTYEGFYALLYDTSTKIAADGSTVVEIKYDRYYYLMNFNLDGGYGVEPIYARYGTPISVGTPTKPGYTFSGWNPAKPETMPAENMTLKAQWTAGNATYVVQYWQENANDNGYSFVERTTKTANAGDTVSGSGDKNYSGFTYDHADTAVVVNGDGSTVVNVYYKRNVYEVKFYNESGSREDTNKRITAKYGAFIGDKWPGNGWYVNRNSTKTAQSYLAIMPLGGKNFYGQQTGHQTATATYYVEVLPGESGTTVSGNTYKVHHTDKANYTRGLFGGGLSVTDEERYDIEGFTCNTRISTKNGSNYNGAKFYYTRNRYELVFDDQYGTTVSERLPFEQVLSKSANHKNNYVPAYPSTLEAGAYEFGGWYTDPGCTQPVDWSAKMPAAKVVLYAKWSPITHTVKTYLTEDAMKSDPENPLGTWEEVPHGTAITNPPEAPERNLYKFVGWFYISDTGEEKAYDFTMPVNRDLNLYAKWNTDSLVEYTINYQLEDGTEIAPPTKGSALAGSTKTFNAKTGTELNVGYQTGYFPLTSSHSLTIDIDGNAENKKNEYTFIYVPKTSVKYTVRYLDKATGEPVVVNGVSTPDKKAETTDAVVTETFKQITGYAPDAYQKRLVLSATEEENVIIFWYTKDDVHAPVQVIHWTQNIAGDGYTEYQSSTNLNGVIGQTYTEASLTIPGFNYNADPKNPMTGYPAQASGNLTPEGLVLNLYYDRIEYAYEFRFVNQETGDKLAEPVTGKARYGAQVTQEAKEIPGYTLVGNVQNQAITIAIEDSANVANKNVKIFYYTEQTVDIKYVAVTADSGTLSSYQDNGVKVITGEVRGSMPTANPGFRFVGWYTSADCQILVEDVMRGAVNSETNKVTPQKSIPLGDGVMAYAAATYFAKFEYDVADLTITKSGCQDIDENQSFIFRVVGDNFDKKVVIKGDGSVKITGLKIGTYTVTEVTSWSWRYTPDGENTQTITLQPTGDNKVDFVNTRSNDKWLGGDAYAKNIFDYFKKSN